MYENPRACPWWRRRCSVRYSYGLRDVHSRASSCRFSEAHVCSHVTRHTSHVTRHTSHLTQLRFSDSIARSEAAAASGNVIGILPVFAAGAALQAAGSTQSASNFLVDAVRLYKVATYPTYQHNSSYNQYHADCPRSVRVHALGAAAAEALRRAARCCGQARLRHCGCRQEEGGVEPSHLSRCW